MSDLQIQGQQSLCVTPVGNPPGWTYESIAVDVQSRLAGYMEFGAVFNMHTNVGGTWPGWTPQDNWRAGKVALYAGAESSPGGGDVWGFNVVANLNAGSGRQATAIEVDVNNNDRDITTYDDNYTGGVMVTVGMDVKMVPWAYRCDGPQARFCSGYVVASNAVRDNAFYDRANGACSYRMEGHHVWGIDTTGAVIDSQAAMRVVSGQGIHNINSAKTTEMSMLEGDDAGNTYLGRGAPGRVRVDKAVVVSSDRRLKTDIDQSPWQALDVIGAVRTAHFSMNGERHTGFIAQDLEPEHVHGLVVKSPDGFLGLDQMALIATLWEANRELLSRVQELEDQRR